MLESDLIQYFFQIEKKTKPRFDDNHEREKPQVNLGKVNELDMSSKQPLKGGSRLRASKKVQPLGNKTDQDVLDKHKNDWANTLTFK